MSSSKRLLSHMLITAATLSVAYSAHAQLAVPQAMQKESRYSQQTQMAAKTLPVNAAPAQPAPQAMQNMRPAMGMPASCGDMKLAISHGITFMTGGTTQEDINAFASMDAEFNLQLLFAAKNNDHLIVYRVRMLDNKGFELLSAKTAGPYLYAHIPAGTYQLEITHEMGAMPIFVKMNIPAVGRIRKTILLQ